MLGNITKDVTQVVTGDLEVGKMIQDNWKMLEVLPD
jgi:hypothetical protein